MWRSRRSCGYCLEMAPLTTPASQVNVRPTSQGLWHFWSCPCGTVPHCTESLSPYIVCSKSVKQLSHSSPHMNIMFCDMYSYDTAFVDVSTGRYGLHSITGSSVLLTSGAAQLHVLVSHVPPPPPRFRGEWSERNAHQYPSTYIVKEGFLSDRKSGKLLHFCGLDGLITQVWGTTPIPLYEGERREVSSRRCWVGHVRLRLCPRMWPQPRTGPIEGSCPRYRSLVDMQYPTVLLQLCHRGLRNCRCLLRPMSQLINVGGT